MGPGVASNQAISARKLGALPLITRLGMIIFIAMQIIFGEKRDSLRVQQLTKICLPVWQEYLLTIKLVKIV